jgi:hypothetical protein
MPVKEPAPGTPGDRRTGNSDSSGSNCPNFQNRFGVSSLRTADTIARISSNVHCGLLLLANNCRVKNVAILSVVSILK